MRVVVTGGCGYKGTLLVEKLLQRGYEVAVIDALWFGNFLRPHPKLEVIVEDIRELGLDTIFQDTNACIHLASVANDPAASLDSKLTWEVNVLATQNLLEICKKNKVGKFIYASSGSVYGIKEEVEVTEDLDLLPISDYNKTKMIAEKVISTYQKFMNTVILRPATVCGVSPRMRFDVAVNALTYSALKNGVITIDGGSQVRPHIHIKDATETYIWALNNEVANNQIYNIGFENLTIKELAEKVATVVQCYTSDKVEIHVAGSPDPRSYRLCSKKILEAGFKPRRTVEDGISDIVEAYMYNGLRKTDQNMTIDWMKRCQIK